MKQQLSFENLAQRKPTPNNSSPEISAREGGLSVAEIGSLRGQKAAISRRPLALGFLPMVACCKRASRRRMVSWTRIADPTAL
jgi:hypothetical protein